MKQARATVLGGALMVLLTACGGDEVESPRREFASDVEACSARMREVYKGLIELQKTQGWQPLERGSIPGALAGTTSWPREGAAPDAPLACPGGAYAGRDVVAYPLPRFPTRGTEPLMACANADGANHAGGETNVLYADGSVVTLSLESEIEAGRLPDGTAAIPVGPDSPIDDLKLLGFR